MATRRVTFVDPITGTPLRTKEYRVFRPGREDRPAKVDDVAEAPSIDSRVEDLLKWVDGDQDRAKLVLARESAGKQRKTLIAGLTAVLGFAPEDEAETSEANTNDVDADDYADGDQGTDGVDLINPDAQEA